MWQQRRRLLKSLNTTVENYKTLTNAVNIEKDDCSTYSSPDYDKAIAFLQTTTHWIYDAFGILLPNPDLLPGANGSVNIYWKTPEFKLLVNVPAVDDELITFNGENFKRNIKVRGTINAYNSITICRLDN